MTLPRARRLFLGVVGTLALASTTAAAQSDNIAPPIRDAVTALFDAITGGNARAIELAACVDQLGPEALRSMGADPGDAESLAAFRAAYVRNVHLALDSVARDGALIGQIDVSAISSTVAAEEAGLATNPDLAITATGIARVDIRGVEQAIDIPVVRLGETWCLIPVSVQVSDLAGN